MIQKHKVPTVIYGAGVVGEALYRACEEIGLKVVNFCDDNINKDGTEINGIEIIHTSKLKEKFNDVEFIISAADISDVVRKTQDLGYDKWKDCVEFLRDFNVYNYEYSRSVDFVEYCVSTTILCHVNFSKKDKIFLRSIDLMITERCPLKCRHCSNLTQYYKNPVDFKTEDVFKEIDRLFGLGISTNEIRLLGGEALMNKESHLVVEKLNSMYEIRKIVIYTNGVMFLRNEQIKYFQNDKVIFIITDYGKLSKNILKLKSQLEKNNIKFVIRKVDGWTDCSKIYKHNRSMEDNIKVFNECCAKNTFTLVDNKFFRCPFLANTNLLRAIPHDEDDYIDIFKEDAKKRLKEYTFDKTFFRGCDFCNGRPFEGEEIIPAIQTKVPLEYKKFIH